MSEEANPSESVPAPEVESATEKPGEFDPFGVDLGDLRTKIESAVEAEATPTEPAPVEEVSKEAPSQEEPPAESAEEVEAVEPEAQEEETPAEAEDDTPTEADELRAMLEVAQAQARHFESLSGSRQGEEGFFKSKALTLEKEIADLRAQIQSNGESAEFVERPVTQPAPASDANTSYLVGLAIREAGQSFLAGNPDALVKNEETGQAELDPELARVMEANQPRIQQVMSANDPLLAATEVSRLLSAAWLGVDRDRKTARLKEIQRRRAEQGKRLKDKKRASAAASTGSPPTKPAKREIDPFAIPLEKLRKMAERESEGG